MSKSSIEWTDKTWNPVVGCTRVSAGCDNCYAVTMTRRLEAMGQEKYAGLVNHGKGHFNGVARLVREDLRLPFSWRKPCRVFVNSMSDLFHEALTNEEITAVFGVMAACPQHTFQVLTKRPERAEELAAWLESKGGLGRWIRSILGTDQGRSLGSLFNSVTRTETIRGKIYRSAADPWMKVINAAACDPLPTFPRNVWLGVSVEDQATADERIPLLLQCPATVRFVSYEPALGAVDFRSVLYSDDGTECEWDSLTGWHLVLESDSPSALTTAELDGNPHLDWIIAGGESGPGARPPKAEWFRSVRDQCMAAGVPFLFKQWGKQCPYDQLPEETKRELDASGTQLYTDPAGPEPFGVGKKRAGRELDGETWNEFPEVGATT